MTTLIKEVSRETAGTAHGRPFIVTIRPRTLELRLKGKRKDCYEVSISELFETLEWRQARAVAAERARAKRRQS